jgi:hypothetical protein
MFKTVNAAEKNKLGIKNGLQIEKLKEGKFIEEGVKEKFIIVKINNIPIHDIDDIIEIFNTSKGGIYIEGIYPNGIVAYYAFGK